MFKWACAAFALACLLPLAGAAYTVQMRGGGGRRIEIPDHFLVTPTTLTYEVAPSLFITLQLTQVDIAATERLNGEAPGSLLRRVAESAARTQEETEATAEARRTLTNRELEGARRERIESEKRYERRRQELGLPTPEDSAKLSRQAAAALRESARGYASEQVEAESYWRERAAQLRAEIVALDAEIDYIGARLDQSAEQFVLSPPSGILTLQPAAGISPHNFPALVRPNISGSPGSGRTNTHPGVVQFPGGSVVRGGPILWPRADGGRAFGRRAFPPRALLVPRFFALSVPFTYSPATRELLIERLYALEGARAAVNARWRLLEDEARRAGALPGWLRP